MESSSKRGLDWDEQNKTNERTNIEFTTPLLTCATYPGLDTFVILSSRYSLICIHYVLASYVVAYLPTQGVTPLNRDACIWKFASDYGVQA